MIPGIELSNGKTNITVAPENLRIYFSEESTKLRQRIAELKEEEILHAMEHTILMCARRNHPDLRLEELREVLDLGDLGRIHNWCKTKSGLQIGPLVAAAAVPAASQLPAPSSSGTSSAPPDGSQTTSSTG